MLQRIQSIFLLLAILVNVATFFVPMWEYNHNSNIEEVSGFQIESSGPDLTESKEFQFFEHPDSTKKASHTAYFSLTIVASLFLLFVIFQFNDRKRQIRMAYVGIVIILLQILSFVLFTQQPPTFIMGGSESATAEPGFALPVIAVLLIYLAIRGIRKDDELVKSVDRIR